MIVPDLCRNDATRALGARLWDSPPSGNQNQAFERACASRPRDTLLITEIPFLQACGHQGSALSRPECALAHAGGVVLTPCWHGHGGVSLIRESETRHILASAPLAEFGEPVRPNGIALSHEGEVLIAHLGATQGAIFSLGPDGRIETVVDRVEGMPMPPANFVVSDASGRLWITVSTRLTPRSRDYRRNASTGFIAVAEPGQRNARIVADGLGYTNECVIDESAGRVYVNETFGRRLSVFDLHADARLSDQRVHAHFGAGTYPDGLAADAAGGLWVTSIVSNRVLHVDAKGSVTVVLEDSDPAHVAWAESAWESDSLDRPHLDTSAGSYLHNVSNMAFGGEDLKDVWLGNLLGDTLPVFRSTVPGKEPVHWRAPIDAWLNNIQQQ